jgi:hypothetical protein
MIFSASSALAVEAKWTEPRYPNVFERLSSKVARLMAQDAKVSNSATNIGNHVAAERAAIGAWLDLLSTRSTLLSVDNAGEAVYQMIHRAASACSTAVAPSLVYLHFSPSPTRSTANFAQYRKDLGYLHSLMGAPSGDPFFLVDLSLKPTAAFRAIDVRTTRPIWDIGSTS